MGKNYLILLFFLQSWILFGFLMTTPIQSGDAIQEEPRIQAKTSAAEDYIRIISQFRINNYTSDDQVNPVICRLSSDKFAVAWESHLQDASGYEIYTSVFSATTGLNLTNEVRANHHITASQLRPSICALSDDSYAVAWQSWRQDASIPDSYSVYARIFNATTGKNITAEFRANHVVSDNQERPSICVLSSGNLLITWESDHIGSNYDIYARVFNATTGKNVTKEFQLNDFTANNQRYPSVCALSNDTFIAAWHSLGQDPDSSYGTYARAFNGTTGKNITMEFRLNNETSAAQQLPSISTLSDDLFAAAWQSMDQDGNSYGVYTRVFNSTTCINTTLETLVNQETWNSQGNPSICRLSSDYYVASWESDLQDTPTSMGVYARIMNAETGKAVTNEFLVNQNVTDDQRNPSICGLSSTSFAVVWESEHDGGQYDIYCTIYGLKAAGIVLIGGGDDDDDDDDDAIPGYDLSILIGGIALISVALILVRWKLNNSFKN